MKRSARCSRPTRLSTCLASSFSPEYRARGLNAFQRDLDSPSSDNTRLCSSESLGKSVMIW